MGRSAASRLLDDAGIACVADASNWQVCMTGPNGGPYAEGCEAFDFNFDDDVDLGDARGFQLNFAPAGP